jgi:hypothetical protein
MMGGFNPMWGMRTQHCQNIGMVCIARDFLVSNQDPEPLHIPNR